MSARMDQHNDWKPRNMRLWYGGTPERREKPEVRSRPTSPFKVVRPRWARLFVRPIDELDEFGNIVVESFYIPQWKRIALEVCAKHNIGLNEIISARRDRYVVAARHEAFWRCRNETSLSYPQIGMKFGGRDHTTVLHGIRTHEKRMREAADGQPVS